MQGSDHCQSNLPKAGNHVLNSMYSSYYWGLLTTFGGGGTSLLWVADRGWALQIYCSLHTKILLVKLKATCSDACIP